MSDPITNHIAQALARLPEQFKDATNMNDLIEVFADRTQDLEDVLQDVYRERWIADAEGKQLDRIGDILEVLRGGFSDDEYRSALLFKVYTNASNGEPERIIAYVAQMTEGTILRYFEYHPAAFEIFSNGSTVPNNLTNLVQGISPAAVNFVGIVLGYGSLTPFTFAIDDVATINPAYGGGFAEEGYSTDGQITELFQDVN